MLGAVLPALARGGFVIRDVRVEASADTPIAARETAHREGFRLAWQRLLEAEAPDQVGRLATLPDAELDRLINGFEIEREHVTTSRYSAVMTVFFRPEPVRALLARGAVGPVQIEARAVFTSLAEWTEIRRRLAASPAVSQVELRGLSATVARLGLTLTAGPEQAVVSLAAAGLVLGQGPDGWRLSRGAD
ncbi:hypothetical protein [Elioraea sp.]|uniref:hypothetical protein n=1 Tax=Elioraea sp. TaxID=2185103 RepID=UPI003F72909F